MHDGTALKLTVRIDHNNDFLVGIARESTAGLASCGRRGCVRGARNDSRSETAETWFARK